VPTAMAGNVPITDVDTASVLIVDMNSRVQFATWLMIAFASVATFLALIGVYGSLSCVVRQRKPEIAVRIALGAEPADIVRMVLTATGRCALAGLVIGLPLALGLSRALRSLLFATSPAIPRLCRRVPDAHDRGNWRGVVSRVPCQPPRPR
jgi:ABC-type antimicrobial peptide transport system permease subunit